MFLDKYFKLWIQTLLSLHMDIGHSENLWPKKMVWLWGLHWIHLLLKFLCAVLRISGWKIVLVVWRIFIIKTSQHKLFVRERKWWLFIFWNINIFLEKRKFIINVYRQKTSAVCILKSKVIYLKPVNLVWISHCCSDASVCTQILWNFITK